MSGAEYETAAAELKSSEKSAMDVIFSRKSVRHYTETEVEREKLLALVKAGMAAPAIAHAYTYLLLPQAFSVSASTVRPMVSG